MALSGVYEIVNLVNGKRYVGSALNLERRERHHFYYLRVNKHHNIHLQRAYNKLGPDKFVFRVIELCAPDQLLSVEQRHVDERSDYNIRTMCVSSQLGLKHSPATRLKLSIVHMGRKNGPHSAETRAKISLGQIGKTRPPISEETRARLRARPVHPMSEETRANIAATLRGRKQPDEVKQKISKTLTGRSLQKSHVMNAAAGHRGKKYASKADISMKKGGQDGDHVSA